jgi:type VI protein secretion system component Hcp
MLLTSGGGGGGTIPLLYEVGFADAVVTSVNVSGATSGGAPTESISLAFTRITWTYYPQSGSGAQTNAITQGWDVPNNVPYNTKIE